MISYMGVGLINQMGQLMRLWYIYMSENFRINPEFRILRLTFHRKLRVNIKKYSHNLTHLYDILVRHFCSDACIHAHSLIWILMITEL